MIASSRDVRLDGVSEAAPGGRTVTRNSIALLMRRAPRDSAKNICSAVHVLLDGKVSPMRPDSGAPPCGHTHPPSPPFRLAALRLRLLGGTLRLRHPAALLLRARARLVCAVACVTCAC